MSDFPAKKHIGLTEEQDRDLKKAAKARGKSKTFLMREYINDGIYRDLGFLGPKTGAASIKKGPS